MERHALAIIDDVTELGELGLIADVHAEVRVSPAVPTTPGQEPSHSRIDSSCWPSVGGARCSERPPENGLSSNRIGEPGRFSDPWVACSTASSRPCDERLVPGVDVVHRPHLAGRHAGVGEQASQCSAGWSANRASIRSISASRFATRWAFVAKPVLGGVPAEGPAQRAPQALGPARDLHRRIGGLEHAVRRDRRVVVAREPGHLTGHRPAGALVRVHADHPRQQRRPDDRPTTGAFALVQGGQHAVRAVHAGDQVGDRHPDLGRLLGAGDRHQPALALGDLVVAGAGRLRTVVAEVR